MAAIVMRMSRMMVKMIISAVNDNEVVLVIKGMRIMMIVMMKMTNIIIIIILMAGSPAEMFCQNMKCYHVKIYCIYKS